MRAEPVPSVADRGFATLGGGDAVAAPGAGVAASAFAAGLPRLMVNAKTGYLLLI